MGGITVLRHIGWKNGLAVLRTPGVFRHQMAGAALRGGRIRHATVEGTDVRQMLAGVQGTMDVTALTVPKDNEIAFVRRQLTPQGFFERIRPTGSETQQRDDNAEQPMETQCRPRWMSTGKEERETGFEPATFSLGS